MRRRSSQRKDVSVLLLGALLACSHTTPTSHPEPSPSASPVDAFAGIALPGATNALTDTVADAPAVSLVGEDVWLDGHVVADVRAVASTHRVQRVDGLFDPLRARRELWQSSHVGATFSGAILFAFPDDTTATVVKSVFQTAAFAGYPNASFLVRTKGGLGRLPVDAQVPGVISLGLAPEKVRTVVVGHEGALRTCYEIGAQRDPKLQGEVVVTWEIAASGAVASSSIKSSTMGNATVEACILRQVASWSFPSSNGPTNVGAYPFRFGVSN